MHKLKFLRSMTRNPFQMGAVAPSSRHLGQAMRESVNVLPKMPMIELGAGTGSITRSLADAVPVLVEIDANLSRLLSQKFPECVVHNTCAVEFLNNLTVPSGLVISLPLINNPMKNEIVEAIQKAYQNGVVGWCVIFTYGFKSPLAKVGFKSSYKSKSVIRNIPPAHVWVYH